jgi:hypothetical protein
MVAAGRSRLEDRVREEGGHEYDATSRLAARRGTVFERGKVIAVEVGGIAISGVGVLIRKQASLGPEVVGQEAAAWMIVFENSLWACHVPG